MCVASAIRCNARSSSVLKMPLQNETARKFVDQ